MFAVVIQTDFNEEMSVIVCDSRETAVCKLQEEWELCYNANNFVDEEESYHEDDFAIITKENGNKITFSLLEVEEYIAD